MNSQMIQAAVSSLKNERFLGGKSVGLFESEFSSFVGSSYSIAVNSGTSALIFCLLASNIGKGDMVIVPSASFVASANSIRAVGATPVFVDINPLDYCIDARLLEKTLTESKNSVKAIMPVHLYGRPSNLHAICKLCNEFGATLIEDACQAHGAVYQGKKVGTFGDASAFSFYPSKNMTVGGDGGMIVTDKAEVQAICNRLRDQGRSVKNKYLHDTLGFTARLNTINAAIGREQLSLLPQWLKKRRTNARRYNSKLRNVDGIILPPADSDEIISAWHQFVIRTERRDELITYLSQKGIETGIHYPIPIHRQPIYEKEYAKTEAVLPETESWSRQVLSIPVHQNMNSDEVDFIAESIKQFFEC